MWIFIDCYDSFSYSLIDLLKRFHDEVCVLEFDDENLLNRIDSLQPSRIILSPGPGHPRDYPILFQVINQFQHLPVLGVCLGHQIIGEYFGYKCSTSGVPLHGKTSMLNVLLTHHPIFRSIATSDLSIMHYHSLVLEEHSEIECLKILAVDEKKQVMMIEHHNLSILGMQFHPESILTPCGLKLIENWSKMY